MNINPKDKKGKGFHEGPLAGQGVIRYESQVEGDIRICLVRNPTEPAIAVSLSIDGTVQSAPSASSDKAQDVQKAKEDALKHLDASKDIYGHLHGLEIQLQSIILNSRSLNANADYVKEREVKFHEQSVEMNTASRFWPMVHVAVLLATGFTQVRLRCI